jgi:hypothetical protein
VDQSSCEVNFRSKIGAFRVECQPAILSTFKILVSRPQPSINFPQIWYSRRKGNEVKLAPLNKFYQVIPEAYARCPPIRGGFRRY